MAAMGLGGLYMVHLLAQDYNKIRKTIQPITKVLLGKRDLSNLNRTKLEDKQAARIKVDWNNILKNDPFKCLESLVCQVVAGSESTNPDAQDIQALVEDNISNEKLPSKIIAAYNHGLKYKKNPEKCFIVYKFCIYSARTMLNLLKWCSPTFS